MKKIELAIVPAALLVAAGVLSGCVAMAPEEQAGEWAAEPEEQAGERAPGVEPAAQAEDPHARPVLPAPYNGVCGSGYGVIDKHDLSQGTIYLTYNRSNGKNCVVTIRNNPGRRLYMCAAVSRAGERYTSDCGDFTTYAGPVYVHAPGTCIDWGGSIESDMKEFFNEHCG